MPELWGLLQVERHAHTHGIVFISSSSSSLTLLPLPGAYWVSSGMESLILVETQFLLIAPKGTGFLCLFVCLGGGLAKRLSHSSWLSQGPRSECLKCFLSVTWSHQHCQLKSFKVFMHRWMAICLWVVVSLLEST